MITVDDLITTPFDGRPSTEKVDIINGGKPTPDLNLSSLQKEKNKEYTSHFNSSKYGTCEWLTGCEKRNNLFCWPCLLFSRESGIWNSVGYSDLSSLSTAIRQHEQTAPHLRCHFTLKMFGKGDGIEEVSSDQLTPANKAHNELVKKNIETMKRLIDSVCFLAEQEMPSRENSHESDDSRGLECLNYFRLHDSLLDEHLKAVTVYRSTSPQIQNDLIEAVGAVINEYIKNEIKDSDFVSIILNESSQVSDESKLSTVIRYVHKGELRERFVGFSDVSSDRSAEALFDHVTRVVSEYQIESKLIGQTYDGASVMSGRLNDLQKKVREKFPAALFVHCHAHVLNLNLQQSLSCIDSGVDQCRIFFKTINGLSAFFSKSKRTEALVETVNRKLQSISPFQWCFASRLVKTVHEQRVNLIDFFVCIANDYDGIWDEDSIVQAKGFSNFLKDFQTVLMLEIFSRLFSVTDVLHNTLQARPYDVAFCSAEIVDVQRQLQEERESKFDSIWEIAVASSERNTGNEETMRQMYYEIIDKICEQIDIRYQSFEKLEFLNLLHVPRYSEYRHNFPHSILDSLKQIYESTFDFAKLKSELGVIYSSSAFFELPVLQMTRFMTQNGLTSVFPESYKLATLILTLPSTTASVEVSCSALERIHTYTRNTQRQVRTSNFPTISIERDILLHLRDNSTLYDEVLSVFKQKNRGISLDFK